MQSVGVVILDIVVKTVVVRNLLLYAPVGAFKFPVGLGMVWPRVDQSYVEARQLVLKEGRSLGAGRLPAAALANEARSVVRQDGCRHAEPVDCLPEHRHRVL